MLGQIGAVPAGLLVGELAGEIHRHVDLVHERDRRQRVGHRGHEVVVGAGLRHLVDRLAVQDLVGLARPIALLDRV